MKSRDTVIPLPPLLVGDILRGGAPLLRREPEPSIPWMAIVAFYVAAVSCSYLLGWHQARLGTVPCATDIECESGVRDYFIND